MAQNLVNRRNPAQGAGQTFTGSPRAAPAGQAEKSIEAKREQTFLGNPLIQCKGNILSTVVTTDSKIIAPFNKKRVSIFIQNLGVQNVYVSFDGPTSSSNNFTGSILIPPNGYIELKNPSPINEIYCVSSSGSNAVTVIEGGML